MTRDIVILAALVALGAAFLLAHAVVLVTVLRSKTLSTGWRVLGVVPPLSPWVAFRGGARVGPVLWCVLLVAYLAVRVVS